MVRGPVEHKANIRFRNMNDFRSYIYSIDIDYDSEDVTFTGYVYKLSTPQSKMLNEGLSVKVLITWKKVLNIQGKTVIHQLPECVLSNVLIISPPIKIIQMDFGNLLVMKNIDKGWSHMLEFNQFKKIWNQHWLLWWNENKAPKYYSKKLNNVLI